MVAVKRGVLAAALIVAAAFGFKAIQSGFSADTSRPAAAAQPRNLLLITLDTTRADRLGAYGYAQARTPNLDTLAREGVRFDDAAAQAPITGPSHAAILTGRYPARFGVRDNATTPLPGEAVTLAEILEAKGFATGGFIGAFILDRPYGFAQGFSTFNSGFTRVDPGGEANAERRGDAVVNDAVAWMRGLPAGQPFFGWVHLYDPHMPYEDGYDGEIARVDREIGRLLDALRARGAYDDTLVIAVADHGESLGEHGEDEHGVFLYEPVTRVPWIMRGLCFQLCSRRWASTVLARSTASLCGLSRRAGRVPRLHRRTPSRTTRAFTTDGASCAPFARTDGRPSTRRSPSSTTCATIHPSSATCTRRTALLPTA
jgi:hypothetical protein